MLNFFSRFYFSERLITRKELRKSTRISDMPSLEAAIRKFKRLNMTEEDGDFSAAVDVLRNLLEKNGEITFNNNKPKIFKISFLSLFILRL